LTRDTLKSFFSLLHYFFNGGLGFYFFMKDQSFNISNIYKLLSNPLVLKEYSHLFEQNIQWGNFLSRMIIPELSLVFGLPAGLILLRILFIRNTERKLTLFDVFVAANIASLMPLLHTHTVLTMLILIPVLMLLSLNRTCIKCLLKKYFLFISFTIFFTLPHSHLFLSHISTSHDFFKFHFGWMKHQDESIIWFWFKNTYLLLPFSSAFLVMNFKKNLMLNQLLASAFVIFILINTILFSPYDWDNVKVLFWIGLFFYIATSSLLVNIVRMRNIILKCIGIILLISMCLTALLSIYREVNIKYVLYSKENVEAANFIKMHTVANSVFLTNKVHNSPANNLGGQQIFM
jgi:hypothetical protein